MKLLILGHLGQVGVELQRTLAPLGELALADKESVDLARPQTIRELLAQTNPDVVVNAAAYTAVDKAEAEPELALAINGTAAGVIAEEAARTGALLIHYSTDYVFDGTKPSAWVEDNEPNPINVYGASKLAGEKAITAVGGRYYIFRTSWIYAAHGANFLRTILRLASERDELRIVDDQIGAPTSAPALAEATALAIASSVDLTTTAERSGRPAYGLYHMTCAGQVSWFGFATEFLGWMAAREPGRKLARCIPIATSEYPLPARRPANSVLSNAKLAAAFGLQLPDWRSALYRVLEETCRAGAGEFARNSKLETRD
ncbi:MAG: dTDP-4-dehydrorhamnose reductase [Candidatus Korobacteraceae bacterium]|jgi:dTDP-4-dehydrorhamnose reductase